MNKKPISKSDIFKLLKNLRLKKNLKDESIDLTKAKNRILSKDIKSAINLPPFNNSAVDGYAIHNKDIQNNKRLKCSKKIRAGDSDKLIVAKGDSVRIFTGAIMPVNSKTVVMQENVSVQKKSIIIKKKPRLGENCRLAGEDIAKGDVILKKGSKINSTNLNLIAAIGKRKISVTKKLNVGFYTSGNELKKPTENLKGSNINNSNFYSLKSLLGNDFIHSKYIGILKDSKKNIIKSFAKNCSKHDVIITTGGASVGEEDHLIDVIKKMGKIFFWKTAIKPGRPLAIGKIRNTLIICLPGNPVSVHLLYGMIIKPFLNFLCGSSLIIPFGFPVKTTFSMKKKTLRLEWLRVIKNTDTKIFKVSKHKKQGSGMISSMAYSDGIIEIPENISNIKVGDIFIFYPFETLFK